MSWMFQLIISIWWFGYEVGTGKNGGKKFWKVIVEMEIKVSQYVTVLKN